MSEAKIHRGIKTFEKREEKIGNCICTVLDLMINVLKTFRFF